MACNLTKGFALGCRNNVGGVSKVYIGNWDGPEEMLTAITASDGALTAISAAAGDVFQYDQEIGQATFTETVAQSRSNGTIFYEPTVTIKLNKHCANVRNELLILGASKQVIFVELNMDDGTNNIVYMLGFKNGMMLEASNLQSGAAFGDYTGLEMTFKGAEPEPSYVANNTMANYSVTITQGAYGDC